MCSHNSINSLISICCCCSGANGNLTSLTPTATVTDTVWDWKAKTDYHRLMLDLARG